MADSVPIGQIGPTGPKGERGDRGEKGETGNGWPEWRMYVIEELKRHNKAMENHGIEDAKNFHHLSANLNRIERKLAYMAGAVGVIVFGIEVGFKTWEALKK